MIVTSVPPEYIDTVWGVAGALLRPIERYNGGRILVKDAYHGIIDGKMVLWVVFDETVDEKPIYGVVVTTITQYPSKKYLTILLVGGRKISLWIEVLGDIMTRWATDCQCDGIEGYGRPGWERLLKNLAPKEIWRHSNSVFERDISYG